MARLLVHRLAGRFSVWNRKRKARAVAAALEQAHIRSALLVGVSAVQLPWANMVERQIADSVEFPVTCGLDADSSLAPNRYVRCDALALPFPDACFDLVFSNAVVEHVGGREEQQKFVDEHVRVGRNWILTTPNRWFPVESHTRAVLRHWSARWRARQPDFTRLLSRRDLQDLVPSGTVVHGTVLSPTFMILSKSLSGPARRKGRHARRPFAQAPEVRQVEEGRRPPTTLAQP